jgi:hypothetical protein
MLTRARPCTASVGVWRLEAVGIRGIDGEDVALACGLRAEQVEHIHHGADIAQVRHVGDDALPAREQCRRHERKHGVLGALDTHGAGERGGSFDDEFVHG